MDFIAGYVLGKRSLSRAAGLAASADAFAAPTSNKLYDLNDRIDRMLLVVEAMWSLLEESGYTAEQLTERMQTLSEQGHPGDDGSHAGGRCAGCGAVFGRGSEICQFCGRPTEQVDPFGTV